MGDSKGADAATVARIAVAVKSALLQRLAPPLPPC
jgi:hypothetical protein